MGIAVHAVYFLVLSRWCRLIMDSIPEIVVQLPIVGITSYLWFCRFCNPHSRTARLAFDHIPLDRVRSRQLHHRSCIIYHVSPLSGRRDVREFKLRLRISSHIPSSFRSHLALLSQTWRVIYCTYSLQMNLSDSSRIHIPLPCWLYPVVYTDVVFASSHL
ncbi:hypothetical protein BKA93DRAFT_561319 [Sparassis latifolia]